MSTSAASRRHPLRQLYRHVAAERGRVRAAVACSILNKAADIAPPFLIGIAVDVVVRRQDSIVARLTGVEGLEAQLWVLAAASAVVWILESAFEYLANVLWRGLAQTLQHRLRLEAYERVVQLETAWLEDRDTGGLLAVLNDDVNQLERFLDHGADRLIQTAATIVLIGGALVVLAPSIAALAFLPIPLIVWGSVRFQRALEPRYRRVRDQAGVLSSTLSESLGGMATIKGFAAEDRAVARLRDESAAYRDLNADAIRFSSAFIPMIRMAILAAFCAFLVLGGRAALSGSIEVGTYSVLVFITQRLLWPLTDLGETFDQYQRGMASTRRILGLLDREPAIVDGPHRLPRPIGGAVAFEGVTFSYARGEPVLWGLDLTVPAGRVTAVVGSTGAGKSTLVKLLLRLYDVGGGAVTVDGTDVRALQLVDLRGVFAVVSQDVFLFPGTIAENIAFGRPCATRAEIASAAALAEVSDFVETLPDGYDTVVGERGQKLSGGQRQRIAIARAVLADPRVLVLDEATSAVDNETEAAIQRSLERVAVGRTTLVIAHRLSTVRHADRLHVLERGAVVESGTHDELVTLGGRYAALWRVQTGERDRATV